MHETPDDLTCLQALLDASIAQAGPFLRASFEMPAHSLSAAQLAGALQGMVHVALATVTAKGEPRVAPIGALFYRGTFYIPTTANAARTRHIRQRPAVSLTCFRDNGFALILHGRASVVAPDDPTFATLDAQHQASGDSSVLAWGEGVYLFIEPDVLYTYARDPGAF
ncbi:MAG TPA: pyridoxamine 5'-phosphate oxidase family protein [Ktedonobacterales bacterium]